MKKIFLSAAFAFTIINGFAQTDSAVKPLPVLSFSGYVETYYTYDFNKPSGNDRPGFFYSHNRHNEFNLNLGFIKAAYNNDKVRANLAIGAGTYMNANYSAEPGTIKNIYEANAGVKISRKKNLWLDAGIFSSHIGFESAVSKDCWTLTRSILADNSPYFESGAKLTYTTDNNKWLFSGLVLNGWQRIRRVDGNSMMSFGSQVQFKPSSKALINYSTFIGTDKPDSVRLMRYFHNIYGIFSLSSKLGLTAGFDIGSEQRSKGSKSFHVWYSPVVIVKYALNDQWAVAARVEYYADKNGVIISSATPDGFKTTGFSLNVDYAPVSNAVVRLEARTLKSKDAIFTKGFTNKDNNSFITASVAVSF
ncbi:porin [Ferruginibacter sp. HRS2-29]|uniref:porin n=1 Tax=Ferruginibacter sp. HRS2-29 TaxID=2487334 RepID=UPI0020CE9F95|nr:porin [Ferruginibacter sp. HRS2-29]MCP9749937.1 porin [Ferruginibacter sp. HRS2-29]